MVLKINTNSFVGNDSFMYISFIVSITHFSTPYLRRLVYFIVLLCLNRFAICKINLSMSGKYKIDALQTTCLGLEC